MNDPMPVFVIKAKDVLAVAAVEAYRILCRHSWNFAQAAQVQLALDEIQAWQDRNPDLVKAPDHRHVPAATTADEPPTRTLTDDIYANYGPFLAPFRRAAPRMSMPQIGPASPPGSTQPAQQDEHAATPSDPAKPATATTEGRPFPCYYLTGLCGCDHRPGCLADREP